MQAAQARFNSAQQTPLMVLLYGKNHTPEQWAAVVDTLPFMQNL